MNCTHSLSSWWIRFYLYFIVFRLDRIWCARFLHWVFGNSLEFPQHTRTRIQYINAHRMTTKQKRKKYWKNMRVCVRGYSEMIGIIKMILVDIEFTLCNHAISDLLVFIFSNPPIQFTRSRANVHALKAHISNILEMRALLYTLTSAPFKSRTVFHRAHWILYAKNGK